jgi:DNA polymerase elongation subunit (family B)
MNHMNSQATKYRRTVVLDIETVSLDPNLAKGALDALIGRIVCVGMLIDDGAELSERAIASEDEAQIVTEFWNTIQPTDVIVGHNIHEFDVPFIRQRSWILGIRPTRTIDLRKFYTADVWDSMQVWSNWGFKKWVSLDALGAALHCGQKSGHGMDVAQWWAVRDLDAIKQYCLGDVRVTYLVYCKLTYQRPRMHEPQAGPGLAAVSVEGQGITLRPNRRRARSSGLLEVGRSVQDSGSPEVDSLPLVSRKARRKTNAETQGNW